MLVLNQVALSILYQVGLGCRNLVLVPGAAAEVLPVQPYGYGVSLEEVRTLVPGNTGYVVIVQIQGRAGCSAYVVPVVNVMVPPVAEGTQRTAGILVTVAQTDAGQSACNLRIVIQEGSIGGTGVAGIEVRDVSVGIGLPVFREVIA